MLQSQDFSLVGEANPGVDNVVAMCDASHRGDRLMTSRSQTGVITCLNVVCLLCGEVTDRSKSSRVRDVCFVCRG